eukprot:c23236_g1_i1 orf=247-1761(+)
MAEAKFQRMIWLSAWLVGTVSLFVFVRSEVTPFDVRQHLSTTTRYGVATNILSVSSKDDIMPPAGCVPIHLNLVARHGTRSPTKRRIKDLDEFADRLKVLVSSSPKESPGTWLHGWQSPWKGRNVGGELVRQGEEEMFELGKRLRYKFPDIFQEDYHPATYLISATQVPRASASAVAFGMGLFSGNGTLGPGQHRAFAVISDSRSNDIHLRFHECCHAYKESKALRKPAVDIVQQELYLFISGSMADRHKLGFTSRDVMFLWYLCKQEATVLGILNQSCALFTPEEVELLEWADDVELHLLKGYGESINYRMGVPLLNNVVESMEQTILAREGGQSSRFLERVRLRFAHAETLVPFTCLLGLFLNETDVKLVQREQPLDLPPRPPRQRLWRGNLIAPYGANIVLVLYKCSGNKEAGDSTGEFLVHVLHNEKPVAMPACNGTFFCPFQKFKDDVALPHLKYSFESVCSIELKVSECSWTCWLSRALSKLFKGFTYVQSYKDNSEL